MSRLNIEQLGVRYGEVRAVSDVSFAIEEGELVGLIGPNGAGKTTLIDGVTGLVSCSGHITLGEHPIDGLPPHRRAQLGLVRTFQGLELFEDLTVRENLTAVAVRANWWSPALDLVRPRTPRAAQAAVDHALEFLGISELWNALPRELSLGQRKLVTVARALAAGPRVLLLDEPAAGLDADESLELGAKLRQIVDAGTSVLLVDHDMGLVLGVCHRVAVLDFGELIALGPPATVRADPRVISAYIGADEEPGATSGGSAVLA